MNSQTASAIGHSLRHSARGAAHGQLVARRYQLERSSTFRSLAPVLGTNPCKSVIWTGSLLGYERENNKGGRTSFLSASSELSLLFTAFDSLHALFPCGVRSIYDCYRRWMLMGNI